MEAQNLDLDHLVSLKGVSAEERELLRLTVNDVRKHFQTILDVTTQGYVDTPDLLVRVEDKLKASLLGPLSRVQLRNYLFTILYAVPLLVSLGLTALAYHWFQSVLALDEYTILQLMSSAVSMAGVSIVDGYLFKETVANFVGETRSSWGELATKENPGIRIPFSVNSILLTETGVSRASIPADRGYGEFKPLNRGDSMFELLTDTLGVEVEGLDYETMDNDDFINSVENYLSNLEKALRLFKTNSAAELDLRLSEVEELERKSSIQANGSTYETGVDGKEYLIDPLLNLKKLEEQIDFEIAEITALLALIREQMAEHLLQLGVDYSQEKIKGYSTSEPDAILQIEKAIEIARASIELKIQTLNAVLTPLSNIFLSSEDYDSMDPDQALYDVEDFKEETEEEIPAEVERKAPEAPKVLKKNAQRRRRPDTSCDVWR